MKYETKTVKISELEGARVEYLDHVDGVGDMSFAADVFRVDEGCVIILVDGDHNEIEVYPEQVIGIIKPVKIEEAPDR